MDFISFLINVAIVLLIGIPIYNLIFKIVDKDSLDSMISSNLLKTLIVFASALKFVNYKQSLLIVHFTILGLVLLFESDILLPIFIKNRGSKLVKSFITNPLLICILYMIISTSIMNGYIAILYVLCLFYLEFYSYLTKSVNHLNKTGHLLLKARGLSSGQLDFKAMVNIKKNFTNKKIFTLIESEFIDYANSFNVKLKHLLLNKKGSKNPGSIELFEFGNIKIKNVIISKIDFKRGSKKDKIYSQKYKMQILKIFNNRCCKCDSDISITMDHFYIPKSKGGSFYIELDSGLKINNMIPLCSSCNSSKNNKSYLDFFSEERIKYINKKLYEFNYRINF